jgi:hypothetical protein
MEQSRRSDLQIAIWRSLLRRCSFADGGIVRIEECRRPQWYNLRLSAGEAPAHSIAPMSERKQPERRHGPADRRLARQDRRNTERAAADPTPRRDPELADRREAVAISGERARPAADRAGR